MPTRCDAREGRIFPHGRGGPMATRLGLVVRPRLARLANHPLWQYNHRTLGLPGKRVAVSLVTDSSQGRC